jgi:hypothetical protein
MLRRIKWVDIANDQFDLNGSDVGWGATISSNLKFGKNDIGRFQIVYGEGIQNYLNDAPVDVGIMILNPSDPVRPPKGGSPGAWHRVVSGSQLEQAIQHIARIFDGEH